MKKHIANLKGAESRSDVIANDPSAVIIGTEHHQATTTRDVISEVAAAMMLVGRRKVAPKLPRILGPEWSSIRWQKHNNEIMYFACDVKELLGLSNVTTATRGVSSGHRVARDQRVKTDPYDPKIRARVILLTLSGVFQLILNNYSPKCKQYRDYIAVTHLPGCRNLVLFSDEQAVV